MATLSTRQKKQICESSKMTGFYWDSFYLSFIVESKRFVVFFMFKFYVTLH